MPRLAALLTCLVSSVSLAGDFERSVNEQGQCLGWGASTLVFAVDAAGSGQGVFSEELAAVEEALETWQAVAATCSPLQLVLGPTVQDAGTEAVQNLIVFRKDLCADVVPEGDECALDASCGDRYRCWSHARFEPVHTTSTYRSSTGELLGVDVELNAADYTFTTTDTPACTGNPPGCTSIDLQGALTRELGRALGLEFIENASSTMSVASGMTADAFLSKRQVDTGTAAGFCTIYPPAGGFTRCDGSPAVTPEPSTPADGGTSPDPEPTGDSSGCSQTSGLGLPLGALLLLRMLRGRLGVKG